MLPAKRDKKCFLSLLQFLPFFTSQELAGISFRESLTSLKQKSLFSALDVCYDSLHFAHYLLVSSLSFKEMCSVLEADLSLASLMPLTPSLSSFLPDPFPASRIFQSFNRPINLPSHYHSYQWVDGSSRGGERREIESEVYDRISRMPISTCRMIDRGVRAGKQNNQAFNKRKIFFLDQEGDHYYQLLQNSQTYTASSELQSA